MPESIWIVCAMVIMVSLEQQCKLTDEKSTWECFIVQLRIEICVVILQLYQLRAGSAQISLNL